MEVVGADVSPGATESVGTVSGGTVSGGTVSGGTVVSGGMVSVGGGSVVVVTIVERALVMAFHCLIAGDCAEVIATLSMKAIWSVVARPRSSTVWVPLGTVKVGVVSVA